MITIVAIWFIDTEVIRMSRDYRIVYTDEVKNCKDKIVHLILDNICISSYYFGCLLKECIAYNLLDNTNLALYKNEKFTVDMLADRLMKFIVDSHWKEKLYFMIVYIIDDDYSGFEEHLYNGYICDAYMDYLVAIERQHYSSVYEMPIFKLSNTIGVYFDGQQLHILDKKACKNLNLKEMNYLCLLSFKNENLFGYLLDYKKVKKKEIVYRVLDDYWHISLDRYRFLLSQEEEPEPFIPLTLNQIKKKKSDALESHIWLKDAIISQIPYSDISVKTNVKARKVKDDLHKNSLDVIAKFEHNFRKKNWKKTETENYIAYYCTDRLYTYKIISKQTQKIVCLSYYE